MQVFKKLLGVKGILLIAIIGQFAIDGIAQTTEKQYLSGTGRDNTIQWDFFCTGGMNANKWTTIPVPSNWELQGFGKYDYGFSKDSVRGKENGLYKTSFKVPASWKNKNIRLVFEGVATDVEIKLNGKIVGPVHQGAYYAFKYDISQLVLFGTDNVLEATVAKHSANESVNDAERRGDFWIFGGIFRPVYLEALPAINIDKIAINATANGLLTAQAQLAGKADKWTMQLYDAQKNKVGAPIQQTIKPGTDLLTISAKYPNPKLWSSEFPNLHIAQFNLYQQGKMVHTVQQKIGFRTVEVRERDGIYVNGVKMKFKGVNRHSFWPNSGRTTSTQQSIDDVLLIKEMNMNAVRMSHYPPDGHFLDVCDSLGLFVIDELAGWHGKYDTEVGTKLVKEMVEHDRNHPSIVLWANGNEGGHNFDLDPLFGKHDFQNRVVIHPQKLFNGVETMHYREYNYGIGNYEMGREIVMPTEFLHGLYDGGHGAGLEDYWEKMWNNPLSAGGFLWDLVDAAVVRTDKNGLLDTDGPRGADGIVGPYREKEGSFFTIKEVWSPVYFERREITSAFNGKLNLENRYAFTNLKECRFSWQLKKLGQSAISTSANSVNGNAVSPDIKPFAKGSIQLNLPANWKDYDGLYVKVTDRYNREIFTWSFPIIRPATQLVKLVQKEGPAAPTIQKTDSSFVVSVNDLQISFNTQNGSIQQVKNKQGEIPFSNGPIIQEGVNNFKGFVHRYDGNHLIIESKYHVKESYNTLQWTIYPSGWIRMQLNYFPSEYFTTMVGVNFNFPESIMKGVEYMGNGPYRVWKNRMKGNQFGIWHKKYNNTETGESWNYPEFKGYHSNMYWCKFLTSGQNFTVATETEDLFFRLFTPAFKTDQWRNYEPTFPKGDISFMQGIAGIGSKTQRAENTGPMGRANIFYDFEKEQARSLQMVLYFNFNAGQ